MPTSVCRYCGIVTTCPVYLPLSKQLSVSLTGACPRIEALLLTLTTFGISGQEFVLAPVIAACWDFDTEGAIKQQVNIILVDATFWLPRLRSLRAAF